MTKLYTSFILVFIASCGGGGGGGNTTPVTPAPLVSIAADPLTVLLTNTSTITWSSTNATSCSASGSWSGSKAISGSEVVTISTTGNNTYALSCTGAGGSGSASVSVEGYRNTDGVVVDGYISGAEVFIDEDDDWVADSNESSTTSDNDGKFTIKYANGNLVSIGGIDLDSQTLLDNLLITHKLTGHTDFKAVTPVTSVAAFMTDATNVNAALGIDSTIDIAIFDPVLNKGDGGINDYLYEKGNQLTALTYAIQNITNDLNTTTETTQDYFKALSEELEKEFTETSAKVDIETEAFITKFLENVITSKTLTIADEAKVNTTAALASVLPVIEVKSDNDLTTGIIRFSLSTLQNDIKGIANGSASAEILRSYKTDILNYIGTDQSIDSGKLAPEITAIADSASTSEDTAVEVGVLINDSFLSSAPIAVTSPNGSNGLVSINNNVITYTPNSDYNGTDLTTYTIKQGDKTSSADLSITIEAVNDEPSIDTSSTLTAAENQKSVATISVSDVDTNDALTLTISGTDVDSFNLSSGNVLTFKTAPDYESKKTYSLTLSLTDATVTVTKDIIINVSNINDVAPVISSSASFSAAENQQSIGSVSASDEEGDILTFSITSTELNITSDGVLTFKTLPDYEIKTSYSAIVKVDDGANPVTQEITVTVTDVNEAPVIDSAESFSANENQTEVGSFVATDPEDASLTYSLSGTDNGAFNISTSGVLSFKTAPNFESKSSYSITANVSDGTNTSSQAITVAINDVNDIPTISSDFPSTFTLAENGGLSNTINSTACSSNANYLTCSNGTVNVGGSGTKETFADEDGDILSVSFTGTDASSFAVTAGRSVYLLANADYETKTSYSATLVLSDGKASITKNFTLNITNLNDVAPVITSSASLSADENQNSAGIIVATDADGSTIEYSVSGTDASSFDINSSTGVLTFKNSPDYETKTTYSIKANAYDGIQTVYQDVTIAINNLNDNSPVFSSSTSQSADENQTSIGTIAASDADGDSITYSVSGTDASSFSINSTSGVLTFNSAPDYETKTSYQIVISATDGTNATNEDITVTVNNLNDNAHIITSDAVFSIPENQTAVGNVVLTDADGYFESLAYVREGGTDKDAFLFASDSTGVGTLTLLSSADYETKNTYSLDILVSDGVDEARQSIIVNITDINEAPVFSSSASLSAAENQTAIGTIAAIDEEGNSLTYSISGTDSSSLLINSSSGVLSFSSAPNYESKSSYAVVAAVSDGTNTTSQNISISISDVNDAPTISSNFPSTFSLAENGGLSDTINSTACSSNANYLTCSNGTVNIGGSGTVVTFEDEDSDTISVSFSGTDASSFAASTGGSVYLNSNADYETKNSYSAAVVISDGTATASKSFTLNIINVNDVAPVITSSASLSAAENQTSAGAIVATDADGSSIVYSISGADAALLSINSSTGVLTFNSAPNYESKTSYSITGAAYDGVQTTSQNITISITNINEAPSFSSSATFSAAENQTAIGSVSVNDPEGSSITYSLSGTDASSLAISSSGVLTFGSAPNFESKNSYSATVSASDGTNTVNQAITISVTDVNEAPAFTSSTSYSVNENQSSAGQLTASDAEGNTLIFSLGSGTDDNNLNINSSTGVLTFKQNPNYENADSYQITASVSDGTNIVSQSVTININNLNEAPSFSSSATFSAAENQTSIGSVSVNDPEGSSITYSLSGTDASSLAISSSGVLTFGSAPNFESKNSYSANVLAGDGTNSTTQAITISVTDVNDAPVATAAAYTMDLKPQAQTSGSLTLAGTDEDGNTLTYSIASNGSYGTASLSGTTVTYQTSASTQSAQSESFTFKVNDGTVDSSAATITISLKTDPLYQYQWHLNNTGQTNFATNAGTSGVDLNVDTVIASGIDGTGIVIAVVDSGLELAHEDLSANIVSNKSYDYTDDDNNPLPTGNTGDHGTSVAGIIAAVGWNNLGVRGVAPKAKLVGYNITDGSNFSIGNFADAVGNVSGGADTANIDIFNMSFGYSASTSFNGLFNSTREAALLNGVTNLRDGKGAIYVNSSGNDWSYNDGSNIYYCGPNYGTSNQSEMFPCWDASLDPMFTTPYIIGVSSLNASDVRSSYSTPGSSVWVSGFGGEYGNNSSHTGASSPGGSKPAIMTVDQSSCSKGYTKSGVSAGAGSNNNVFNNADHSENSSCNYASTFNGTSSAAPTVSGVIALMLDANENLTWRDVKHILATTSTQVDSSKSKAYLGVNQYSWITNAAGHKHHNWYGFGKINAASAVSAAQSYSSGSLGSWVETGWVRSGTLDSDFNSFTRTTYTGAKLAVSDPAGSNGKIEFVRIEINMTTTRPYNVGVEIISPDGTTVPVMPAFTAITTNPSGATYDIGINSLYGENMAGDWTIVVTDYIDNSVGGTLNSWGIKVYGN